MEIFFLGLLMNITAGIFNIPLGPERCIKRFYNSAYSVLNIDLDNVTRKIADIFVYIASSIFVFLIVWTMSEIYNIIPLRFTREIICSLLLCISLRLGQGDNFRLIFLSKCGKKDKVIKILKTRCLLTGKEEITDSDICSAMLYSRTYTIRLIVCPIFIYMCFGIIPLFMYKTAEILARIKRNWAAKAVYALVSFLPAILFRILMRLSGLIIKGRIPSGYSVYKLICSHIGIKENDSVTMRDVIRSECLVYMSIVFFFVVSYAFSLLTDFLKTYITLYI